MAPKSQQNNTSKDRTVDQKKNNKLTHHPVLVLGAEADSAAAITSH